MKSTFSNILPLAILFCVSCEKQSENQVLEKQSEKQALEKPEQIKDEKSISPVDSTASSDAYKKAIQPGSVIAPSTLIKLFKEADGAFANKDYITAAAKLEELLKLLGPDKGAPYESIYFKIGLSYLLGEKYPNAEFAFKDCIQLFPKGEYTSRAYLGLGRALIFQKQPDLKTEALAAFKKAAEDPRYKTEADQWIDQMSESPANP